MQSKRFVIVSFFTTLTLSAVCQGIFGIISESLKDGWGSPRALNVIYAVSYTCFLIKYYIDDVIDDNGGSKGCVSRFRLACLIIGWMLFLMAALFVCDMMLSAAAWIAGMVVITWFLIRNCSQLENQTVFKRYLAENIVLLVFLGVMLCAFALNQTAGEWIGVCCTFAITTIAFGVMLLDDTPAVGQSGGRQSGMEA